MTRGGVDVGRYLKVRFGKILKVKFPHSIEYKVTFI